MSTIGAAGHAEVDLHAEQLRVTADRVATERVVLRRRITEQVRQVEVVVRREELVVDRVSLDGQPQAADAATDHAPLVLVLSEEVPVVQVRTRPYEQVTVRVERVTGEREITETLRREQAEVDGVGSGRLARPEV